MNQSPAAPLRIFHIAAGQVSESAHWPSRPPEQGFVWLAVKRSVLQERLEEMQQTLQNLSAQPLLDLHVSDLLNPQLPSHYDYTSQYDLLTFRRLSAQRSEASTQAEGRKMRGPVILRRIDTSPVGLAVFDRVLLSVHPDDCSVREAYATRLLEAGMQPNGQTGTQAGAKLPTSPADLMLRLVNLMVDQYLDLRRELNRQLDHWQAAEKSDARQDWPRVSVAQDLGQKVLRPVGLGVIEELLGRVLLDDLALVHKDHPIGHRLGKAHLMCDAQHGDALAGELDHHIEHFLDHLRIERGSGLIEQHDLGRQAQCAGNGHALLLTA
jgi:Mg2+ and Co2+ transporter CorA